MKAMTRSSETIAARWLRPNRPAEVPFILIPHMPKRITKAIVDRTCGHR